MVRVAQLPRTRGQSFAGEIKPVALALGLAFGLSVGVVPAASAVTFTVTNLTDLGVGSLRDAITQANATGGPDVVDFQAGLTGTITLASEILITDSVTITGPGAASMNITTSGTGRALHITGTPAVTISGLTFTGNGAATVDGAAIRLFGTVGVTALTVQNCVFTNNVTTNSNGGALFLFNGGAMNVQSSTFTGNQASRGGAIKFYNVGPVTVSGSTISGNHAPSGRGGGMFFYKTTSATVTGSTISGNDAGRGGGIFFYQTFGATTVVDSTISGNTATFHGGGMFFYETGQGGGSVTVSRSTISGNTAANQGGGVFFYAGLGTSTVSDSTISGNTATIGEGGGVVLYDQAVTINNSTLTGNNSPGGTGGGIYLSNSVSSVLTLNSTIVANSTEQAGGTRDIVNGGSGIVNATNSLVENATGITFTVNTANIFGQDPLLGGLANNGGPTLTHALLAGSPAIDTGSNPTALAFDQRGTGFARTNGATTDIGAFEVQGAPPPAPTVTIDQAAAQADPTSSSPIVFTVVFSQVVSGFTASDPILSGTAGATTVTVTGSGATYTVSVSGMTASGTVTVTIPAGAAVNGTGAPNLASTSVDNTVTFNLLAPPPPGTVVGIPTLSQWGTALLSVLMAGWAMLTGFGRRRRR